MDPLIASIIITWLIMRTSRHVRDEWRHSRDTHGGHLSREHPDWSPGRVRRNARRRARGDWLDELGNGFPTLRRTLAEDRLLARTTRAEEEAAGEERVRGLRKRLDIAVDKREAERREAGTQPDPVTWGPGPDHPQVPPGSPGTPHTPAVVPPLPADVGKPQPGVTHHDHTYVPLGGCPECGGPGPGIPLVRGDRVTGTAADGTRIPGTVISSDGETAVTELDGGRRITSPAVVPVGPLPAPPPACGVGACQNPVAPGRLFCAGCEAAIYAPRADAKPDDSAWLEPGEKRCEGCGGSGANPDGTDACPVCRGWGSAPPDPDSPVHPDGTICRACGNPGSPGDPVVSDSQIHRSHVLEAQARYQDDLARRREAGASAIDDAVIGADHDYQGEFDPFPEPEDGNWPTGLPHRRNGDGTAAMPTAFMTAGELENYRRTGEFAAGAQPSPTPPATNGGSTVSTTVFDGALEGADTPHEAMQQAFQAFGASAAKIAQSASDDLAAAAAVHGMDRDPQTMADIAEIADQAAAVQARAQQAASGLASRHADGAEYHGTGTDAHASAFRPS